MRLDAENLAAAVGKRRLCDSPVLGRKHPAARIGYPALATLRLKCCESPVARPEGASLDANPSELLAEGKVAQKNRYSRVSLAKQGAVFTRELSHRFRKNGARRRKVAQKSRSESRKSRRKRL
jgi:hypothetical protein